MRLWLSGPRILNGLVRPGISLGREDWNHRLPSWRRYELRNGLQAAAEARGEPMSREDCDYIINKCLATGGLDSAGNLAFPVKGTREEIVEQILERAGYWGHPMTREQAKAKAVRHWVDGKRHPRPLQMRAIVRATKGAVSPNDFFTEPAE